MPLPFLNKKQTPGVIVKQRKPDEVPSHMAESGNEAMEACAQDILRAVESKDFKHLALAIQAAVECAMEPAQEDNSFEGRNIAAAQQESE